MLFNLSLYEIQIEFEVLNRAFETSSKVLISTCT